MPRTRRDVLKLAAAGAASLVARGGSAFALAAPKPLRILILGGTGFIGPHQVRYALARGHKLTLFNRGRRPKEWPAPVEELTGDRNTGDLKALEGKVAVTNLAANQVLVADMFVSSELAATGLQMDGLGAVLRQAHGHRGRQRQSARQSAFNAWAVHRHLLPRRAVPAVLRSKKPASRPTAFRRLG